jgi:hypothetical protein
MRTADPFYDLDRDETECEENEKFFPVCDVCGETITDDYYYELGEYKFHLDCAWKLRKSVDDYVEDKKNGSEI